MLCVPAQQAGRQTQIASPLHALQQVTNNWYPGEVFKDGEIYPVGATADSLAATAKQALYEYYSVYDDKPLYGKASYGKHLDVFLADMRSYRCLVQSIACLAAWPACPDCSTAVCWTAVPGAAWLYNG